MNFVLIFSALLEKLFDVVRLKVFSSTLKLNLDMEERLVSFALSSGSSQTVRDASIPKELYTSELLCRCFRDIA